MRPLAQRSALAGIAAFGVALLLFFGVGGFRLWPRISGEHLPWSLIWPFARPLLAAALELAFLVSVPIALGVAVSVRRARIAGQTSWQATALATGLLAIALGGLSFGASLWLDGTGSSPGQLATELVASARESCVETEGAARAEVSVPMLGFAWICEPRRAPRLHGRAPLGKKATFEAGAISLGDDLKRIVLERFTLGFPIETWSIRVHAEHATLSGLPPWGRSRRTPIGLRVCLFTLSTALAAYAVGRLASDRPWLPAWAGALLGASVSCWLWWAVTWLERQEPHAVAYLALPAAGLAGALLCAVVLLFVQRLRDAAGRGAP